MIEKRFGNKLMIKKLTLTVSFYLLAWIIIGLLEKWSPSGPCTPGLGVLASMGLAPFVFVLAIVNAYTVIRGSKSNLPSTIIHFVVSLIIFIKFTSL